MKLGVYSLQKVLYDGDAKSVTCPSTSGEITILEDHEPLISMLKDGVVKVVDTSAKDHYIEIGSGFVEVRAGGEVKVLVEETKKT